MFVTDVYHSFSGVDPHGCSLSYWLQCGFPLGTGTGTCGGGALWPVMKEPSGLMNRPASAHHDEQWMALCGREGKRVLSARPGKPVASLSPMSHHRCTHDWVIACVEMWGQMES